MIIRNIKLFSFQLFVLVIVFVWLLKLTSDSQNQRHLLEATKAQSTIISSISLLLAQFELESASQASNLLMSLNNIPGISGWQLLNSDQQLVSDSGDLNKSLSQNNSFDYRHTLYLNIQDNQLFTLKVTISQPVKSGSALAGSDYLLVILFMVAILFVGFYQFHWLYRLEHYARYILANDNKPPRDSAKLSSNPISQTINQLILKNSLLLKDKMDLTNEIRKISFIDDCTELGNQLFFKAEFEVRLHNHEEAESGIMMLLSFCEFDSQNQLVLDNEKLQAIANLLRHFIADIPNGIVARLKGTDFALLMPQLEKDKMDELCKNLISQLDKSIFDLTNVKDHFVDIGISGYKQGFDYYKILAEADMALRNAQLQGGNNWFMYSDELASNKVRGNLKWRSFLQRVLEDRQILLFGQKIENFKQHDLEQTEIYIRIEDNNELLTAETFLPMAIQCGLAVEFDRQVVDGVIKHCLYQQNQNQSKNYTINLFINSLLDEKFVTWLVKKLSLYPALCRQICFEIKEANINQNLPKLKVVMSQLSILGIRWSIDKFGSPVEEQVFIDVLPISRVKIDRRFVKNINFEKSQQLFLQSLLINLNSKGIEVYVDGVEKEADAKYLMASGISGAQGYYYGKPERLNKIEKLLRAV